VYFKVTRAWRYWLNRRGGRKKLRWSVYQRLIAQFQLPRPRIVHHWGQMGASLYDAVLAVWCLCVRTETDDAGCCVKRHPCRMETCGTEEPDEGKLHVRICGGADRAIVGSTRTKLPRPPRQRRRPR